MSCGKALAPWLTLKNVTFELRVSVESSTAPLACGNVRFTMTSWPESTVGLQRQNKGMYKLYIYILIYTFTRFDKILLCLDKHMTLHLKVVLGIVLNFKVR